MIKDITPMIVTTIVACLIIGFINNSATVILPMLIITLGLEVYFITSKRKI